MFKKFLIFALTSAFFVGNASAGFWSDIKDGAKDALTTPGVATDENISNIDADRADRTGEQREGNMSRANKILDTGLKADGMHDVGNSALEGGEIGIKNFLVRIARDMRNIGIPLAVMILMFAVVRMVFSGGEEEEAKKLKTTAIWATVGLIIMGSSYAFIETMFGQNIDDQLARSFAENIFGPFTRLLQVGASFVFMSSAFYGFYKIITAKGDEGEVKKGKTVFINAVFGFLMMKVVEPFVYSLYGKDNCKDSWIFKNCEIVRNVGDTVGLVGKILNWLNGFIAIITVLFIIYAGFQVITSGGEGEKLKKAKGTIKYIVIGLVLLVASYITVRFYFTTASIK